MDKIFIIKKFYENHQYKKCKTKDIEFKEEKKDQNPQIKFKTNSHIHYLYNTDKKGKADWQQDRNPPEEKIKKREEEKKKGPKPTRRRRWV